MYVCLYVANSENIPKPPPKLMWKGYQKPNYEEIFMSIMTDEKNPNCFSAEVARFQSLFIYSNLLFQSFIPIFDSNL